MTDLLLTFIPYRSACQCSHCARGMQTNSSL
nr:MAG TPA_asm: WCCH motif protein [Caudoviricetes sp.]